MKGSRRKTSFIILLLPFSVHSYRRHWNYIGSAELISSHRQRVADVGPHSDDNDEKPPDFGQDKTKFPQELHHVFDEVAHSRPASCCLWKLGSYVIGSIDSLASTE